MPDGAPTTITADADAAGQRLDSWLSRRFPEHSRSRWQNLILDGQVRLNDRPVRAHHRLAEGDRIAFEIPPPEETGLEPENIPLDILYEDDALLVLNKPPGLVIHPAAGNPSGTLVNALLYHCPDLAGIGGERRPGIVHRLDKDTSGLLVAAKTEVAQRNLTAQFKARKVRKEYTALVRGVPEPRTGTIHAPIGRDPRNRKKMSVLAPSGRDAITHFEVIEAFSDAALLRIRIETGRTHQIRVHLAHRGYPVLGDRLYGSTRRIPPSCAAERQMLHARTLCFQHPVSGAELEFEAPLPDDMRTLIQSLRAAASEKSNGEKRGKQPVS